jgi:type VI protein secretion system component Hcp
VVAERANRGSGRALEEGHQDPGDNSTTMPIYMKLEGIEGNVSANNYRNWIELQSFGNGLSRNVQTVVGAAGEREAGQPHFTQVKITKEQDVSTGDLLRECVANTRGKNVEIDFVATRRAGVDEDRALGGHHHRAVARLHG